jgi:sporulation protein YlmC with PRC-barrel domain
MSSNGLAISQTTTRVLAAGTLTGDRVTNSANEDLGKIEDIMIDLEAGRVAYAVVSFGGFLGLGDKLFAIPWKSFQIDTDRHEFLLDVEKSVLEAAPGFDKDNWPNFADPIFGEAVHDYYGQATYWERSAPSVAAAGAATTEPGDDAMRERYNQPDLPVELRRRPIDVTNFPGSEPDADLHTADPSRTYAVNDTSSWTRKS